MESLNISVIQDIRLIEMISFTCFDQSVGTRNNSRFSKTWVQHTENNLLTVGKRPFFPGFWSASFSFLWWNSFAINEWHVPRVTLEHTWINPHVVPGYQVHIIIIKYVVGMHGIQEIAFNYTSFLDSLAKFLSLEAFCFNYQKTLIENVLQLKCVTVTETLSKDKFILFGLDP